MARFLTGCFLPEPERVGRSRGVSVGMASSSQRAVYLVHPYDESRVFFPHAMRRPFAVPVDVNEHCRLLETALVLVRKKSARCSSWCFWSRSAGKGRIPVMYDGASPFGQGIHGTYFPDGNASRDSDGGTCRDQLQHFGQGFFPGIRIDSFKPFCRKIRGYSRTEGSPVLFPGRVKDFRSGSSPSVPFIVFRFCCQETFPLSFPPVF